MVDELIRLDKAIVGIDVLITKAETAAEANGLFKAKDVIYSQQRYFADVQPIRHGRWINDGDCMLCSCCNYAYNSWFMGSNYCPNCGARMDKS